jgi:hypothetical protein
MFDPLKYYPKNYTKTLVLETFKNIRMKKDIVKKA